MKKTLLSSCLILLLGFLNSARCQTWQIDTVEINLEVFGVANGLSQSLVSSIVQDENGFLWLGTKDGLNRYDGKTFKVYKHSEDNIHSIDENNIAHILIDSDERMWVSTASKGLNLYHPSIDGFEEIKDRNGKLARETDRFLEIGKDTLVTTTSNLTAGKVLFLNKNERGETGFDQIPTCRFFKNLANHALCSNGSDRLQYGEWFYDQYFNSSGQYFTLHEKNKLWCFDAESLIGNKHPVDISLPADFRADRDSIFFFENQYTGETYFQFNNRDIYQINSQQKSCKRIFRLPQGHLYRNNHFFDRDGNMWLVLSNYSLARVNLSAKSIEIAEIGTDLEGMHFELEDRDGNFWFGSRGYGLGKIKAGFDNFKKIPEIEASFNGCWGYRFERPDTKAFFSEELHKLWTTNKNPELKRALESRKGDYQYQAFIDSDQNAWLTWYPNGRESYVLSRFRLMVSTNSVEDLPFRQDLYRTMATAIFSWKGDTAVIISTNLNNEYSLDLFHIDKGLIESFPFPPTEGIIQTRFINDWLVEYPKSIWMATIHGLMHLDMATGNWKIWDDVGEESQLLKNRVALSLCFDHAEPDKYLWIGTQGGWHKMDRMNETFEVFTTEDGLPNDVIYSIQLDEYSNYWLGTNKGLCRYNPFDSEFKTFTAVDGINGNEFNRFQFSKAVDNTMYFGGLEGVTIFQPKNLLNTDASATIWINELRIFNEPIHFPCDSSAEGKFKLEEPIEHVQDLTFDHNQGMITFAFGMIDFGDITKQRFKYRLKGLTENWIELRRASEATFTNLDPGQYTLEVKGKNSAGNWSKKATTLNITILPPWWATWWFRALIFLVAIASVYGFYRNRLNQMLRVERMRNQIAQDLHDEIGSTLSSISLYGAVLKNSNENITTRGKSILDRMINNVSDIMEKMNDMVWTIKSDNDGMDQVVNRMRAFAVEMTEAKNIRLEFSSNPSVDRIKFGMDKRKEIYLIFKEAINNAAKYSEADKLRVQLDMKSGELNITITDDGNGFDLTNRTKWSSGGNGLPGMKRRAERIQSQLEITSELQYGTSVRLTVPTNH